MLLKDIRLIARRGDTDLILACDLIELLFDKYLIILI